MNADAILNLLNITPIDLKMIIVCSLLFVLLWRGLSRYFFAPYIALIDVRESLTVGIQDSSAIIDQKTSAISSEYETLLFNARRSAMQSRTERVAAAKKTAQEMSDSAQQAGQEELMRMRSEIAARVAALRTEAEREAEILAQSVVARVTSHFTLIAIIVTATLLSSTPALAEATHTAGHQAGIASLYLFFVNFAIYAAFIFVLVKKRFASGWPTRHQRIAASVNAGKTRLAAAQDRLTAAERQLQSVEHDIRAVEVSMEQETVRECNDILLAGKVAAERIAKNAALSRQAEERAARAQIRRELGRLVMQRAEATLRNQISIESDRRSRDSAIGSINRLMN